MADRTRAELLQIEVDALKLMKEFGLEGWKFGYGGYKRTLGRCHTTSKIITISLWHAVHDTDEQVWETIRHEIAHAIVPTVSGHGPEWQEAARKTGCKDIRGKCTERLVQPPAKWYAVCSCPRRHEWLKRPKRTVKFVCRSCRTELIAVPVQTVKPKPKNMFDF